MEIGTGGKRNSKAAIGAREPASAQKLGITIVLSFVCGNYCLILN